MQSSPTTSLLCGGTPRLRAGITVFHGGLFVGLLMLGACHDPKIAAYRVPKDADAPAQASAAHGSELPMPPAAEPAPAAAPAPAPAMPAGMPGSDQTFATTSGAELSWTAPAGWQSKKVGSMRKATFELAGPGGATAELAITAFPGDVGGEIANVNRWRGQTGLDPLSDTAAAAAIQRLEVNGLKIGVVDCVDSASPEAMHLLGAMVPYDGSTWFFKLVGPDAVVTSQKAAFLAFLKTLKPAVAAKS